MVALYQHIQSEEIISSHLLCEKEIYKRMKVLISTICFLEQLLILTMVPKRGIGTFVKHLHSHAVQYISKLKINMDPSQLCEKPNVYKGRPEECEIVCFPDNRNK